MAKETSIFDRHIVFQFLLYIFFFQTEEEILSNENDIDRLEKSIRGILNEKFYFAKKNYLFISISDKEPLIKLAMSRNENRHSRPGMDLVRDEVSYGVSLFDRLFSYGSFFLCFQF